MAASPFIVDVTAENFEQEVVLKSQQVPVLIDFWADWCEPCKNLFPVLEKLVEEYAGGFVLAKVNTDEQPQIAAQVGVQSLPTVILLKDGQMADHFMGVLPENQVREFLEKHIGKAVDPITEADALIAENRHDEAIALLNAAWMEDENNAGLVAKILEILIAQGQNEQAQGLVDNIKEELKLDPAVQKVMAELELAEQAEDLPELANLEAAYQADPSSVNAHNLAIAYNQSKRFEQAFELLIGVMQRDRAYTEVRPTLLDMFNTVPDANLVNTYRRKMYTLLY